MNAANSQSNPQQKIAQLRNKFIQQLPARLSDGWRSFERLKQAHNQENIANLHRFFHSIKGTSRSFGFENLANSTLAGDDIANRLLTQPASLPKDWQKLIEESLQRLSAEIALLSQEQAPLPAENTLLLTLPSQPSQPKFNQTAHEQRLIYLCDDDKLATEQLAIQLDCFGYQCQLFTNIKALETSIAQRIPAVLIMDINFPEGNDTGIQTLEHLQQQYQLNIPTIFLSSRNDFHARLKAAQLGSAAYFQKPAPTLDIISVLDHVTTKQEIDPYRIMIIDDEPEVASYHAIILQQAGMITEEITHIDTIIERLKQFRPDLLLMDMYMPCCQGKDLAKMIRQMPEYLGLPIVFLSSEQDRKKQFSAMSVGAEGFLTKPVIPEYLVAAVTIRAERMRILRTQLSKDSLTGLFNHTTTTALLHNTLAYAKRNQKPLAFAMIDIDHFKQVNDTYGHAIGDQVLLAISRMLQQRLRHSDIIGRYGGEEFAIIFPNTGLEEAYAILEKLRIDFATLSFSANSQDGHFSCTFSAGIACYPDTDSPENIRSAADKALYQAKHRGRNQIQLARVP